MEIVREERGTHYPEISDGPYFSHPQISLPFSAYAAAARASSFTPRLKGQQEHHSLWSYGVMCGSVKRHTLLSLYLLIHLLALPPSLVPVFKVRQQKVFQLPLASWSHGVHDVWQRQEVES